MVFSVSMGDGIITCYEEEFSPFFMYTLRRSSMWHAVLFYGRSPSGIGYIPGLFLTLLGVWRFARVPKSLIGNESQYIDHHVSAVCSHLGSYGMGSPGFFGLRFRNGWIIYRLWGANGWLTLNNKLIQESLFPEEQEKYGHENIMSSNELKGSRLQSIKLHLDQYDLLFTKNNYTFCLSLRADGKNVPHWRGNNLPKAIATHEVLKDAIVVSQKGSLWLPK